MGEDTAKLIPIIAFLVLGELKKYPKSTQDIKDSKAQEKKKLPILLQISTVGKHQLFKPKS